MAIHIQDDEVDWLVRDFARRRRVGITTAIKLAVQEATKQERVGLELARQRMEPLWKDIRAARKLEPHDHRKSVEDGWAD
ncbi:MAG: type II toxin-antitoxin system VapB family antitoxin [Mesorhizobium sp.]